MPVKTMLRYTVIFTGMICNLHTHDSGTLYTIQRNGLTVWSLGSNTC